MQRFQINRRNLVVFKVERASSFQVEFDLRLNLLIYLISLKLNLFNQIIVDADSHPNHQMALYIEERALMPPEIGSQLSNHALIYRNCSFLNISGHKLMGAFAKPP